MKILLSLAFLLYSSTGYSQHSSDTVKITLEIPAKRVYNVGYRCQPDKKMKNSFTYTVLETHNKILNIEKKSIYFDRTDEDGNYLIIEDSTSSQADLLKCFKKARSVSYTSKKYAYLADAGIVMELTDVSLVNEKGESVATVTKIERDPHYNSYQGNQNNYFTIAFIPNIQYHYGENLEIKYNANISMQLECGASFDYNVNMSMTLPADFIKVTINSNPQNADVFLIPNYRWEAMFNDQFSEFFGTTEKKLIQDKRRLLELLSSEFALYKIKAFPTPVNANCLEYVYKVICVKLINGQIKISTTLFRPLLKLESNVLAIQLN